MDEETFRRAKHAIAEIIRTEEAAVALEANNTAKLGELMNQSHDSLWFSKNESIFLFGNFVYSFYLILKRRF